MMAQSTWYKKYRLGENDMGDWFVLLYGTGPIGIGFFLMGLGVLFWGIGQATKADAFKKNKSSVSR